MAKVIKVGESSIELVSQEDYESYLKCKNIQCLKNPAGNEIYGFAALVGGLEYTWGPARVEVNAAIALEEKLQEQPLGEQKALDGELKFVNVNQKKIAGFLQDSLVFVRQETKACWDALENAFESKHNLSLTGPPGTGKSTTAWAWALWKARQQRTTVTWFHYDGREETKVVIDGRNNRIYTGGSPDKSGIGLSLGTILIVDGVTRLESRDLSRQCTRWFKKHDRTGMFVLVSSQAAKVAGEHDDNYRIKTHLVGSWSQADYLLACAEPVFFATVEKNLECPSLEQLDDNNDGGSNKRQKKDPESGESAPDLGEAEIAAQVRERVATKYYYAGGSARWMFEKDYAHWKADADNHLKSVRNYNDIFYYGLEEERVNHLRGATKVDGDVKYFFISQYIAKQLVPQNLESRFIIDSYAKAEETKNPAFRGWIFEVDVDYQLNAALQSHSPMPVEVEGKREIWNVPQYLRFGDIGEVVSKVEKMEDGDLLWAKPARWHNPAYDFLCFSKVGSEINLHILKNATYADKHDLLLSEVQLLARKFVIERIRFEFVVSKGNLSAFEIAGVTGNLAGWKNMKNVAWPTTLKGNFDFADEFVVRIEVACTN